MFDGREDADGPPGPSTPKTRCWATGSAHSGRSLERKSLLKLFSKSSMRDSIHADTVIILRRFIFFSVSLYRFLPRCKHCEFSNSNVLFTSSIDPRPNVRQ